MSTANAFKLEWSQILLFGKEISPKDNNKSITFGCQCLAVVTAAFSAKIQKSKNMSVCKTTMDHTKSMLNGKSLYQT